MSTSLGNLVESATNAEVAASLKGLKQGAGFVIFVKPATS
jgi:cyanate permease